jgi:hypothetical protein
MERFNLKKASNTFATSEELDAEVEINSAWEVIRENIKISVTVSLGQCFPTWGPRDSLF